MLRLLRLSCLLTLLGLLMCLWSLLSPKPIPVIMALSVAQGVGSLAFVIYLAVLYFDLRLARTLPRALGLKDRGDKE
ncbi:MAG: hypothetical protein U1E65_16445 [Myxococcota bacterium]